MKLKEAFSRLRFTLGNQNKPNQKDIDAFNEIAKQFKLSETETIQDNLLFAKLYTYVLAEFVNHYTDVQFANKQLNKVLNESMELRTNKLLYNLKQMEYRNYFNNKKVLDPFLKTQTVEELEQVHNRYKDEIKSLDVQEFNNLSNKWDINSVIYNIETSINLSIQNFKNNV